MFSKEIAKYLGCSLEELKRADKAYAKRRQHRRSWMYRAHKLVGRAVKLGVLPHAYILECVDCGKQAEVYDHRDYRDALNVSPVCMPCNIRRGEAWTPKFAASEYLLAFEQYPYLFGIPRRRTLDDMR